MCRIVAGANSVTSESTTRSRLHPKSRMKPPRSEARLVGELQT